MARLGTIVRQRTLWTALVGLAALAFWVVAFGVGWREWILTGPGPGIVAHTSYAGTAAMPWLVVAAILTLTTVVMGVGLAVVRHIVEGTTVRTPPTSDGAPIGELPPGSDDDSDDTAS